MTKQVHSQLQFAFSSMDLSSLLDKAPLCNQCANTEVAQNMHNKLSEHSLLYFHRTTLRCVPMASMPSSSLALPSPALDQPIRGGIHLSLTCTSVCIIQMDVEIWDNFILLCLISSAGSTASSPLSNISPSRQCHVGI